MFSEDLLIPLVAIIAVFGPAFYVIYLTGKLIRYRIDKKYKAEHSVKAREMAEFMERTETRLRALEEIVSDDEFEKPEKSTTSRSRTITPDIKEKDEEESESDEDIWSGEKSKLKNQLKS